MYRWCISSNWEKVKYQSSCKGYNCTRYLTTSRIPRIKWHQHRRAIKLPEFLCTQNRIELGSCCRAHVSYLHLNTARLLAATATSWVETTRVFLFLSVYILQKQNHGEKERERSYHQPTAQTRLLLVYRVHFQSRSHDRTYLSCAMLFRWFPSNFHLYTCNSEYYQEFFTA